MDLSLILLNIYWRIYSTPNESKYTALFLSMNNENQESKNTALLLSIMKSNAFLYFVCHQDL